MIEVDLYKQPVLDANLKAIQKINFTGYLAREAGLTTFFIIEEPKETVLDFS